MKHDFKAGDFGWCGIEAVGYQTGRGETAGQGHRGVTRHVLSGARGEPGAFELRYFDVAPEGFTRLERHAHIHSVTVLRGRGYAVLDEEVYLLCPFDHVYVPPKTLHQFVNDSQEPFGFLCVVDAVRDRPKAANAKDLARLRSNLQTRDKIRT